ncbi:MAG: endonuclease III [Dehalococcoidia bacterium]
MLRPRSVRGIKPYSSEEVYERLSAYFGPVQWGPRLDGTSELVWTILSQHTSDLNAGRAFESLTARYPTWQEVVDAPTAELAGVIRHGGLAQQKAPRIQQVLRTLQEKTGGYDIAFLGGMPMEEAKAWLQALPGVGPKTAGVVLSFAIGMPAMAVDTHIHRVSRRLALIGPKVTADEAHDILERSIAPERVWAFHVYLITHGRQVCKAQRPLCHACVLAERCPARPLYTDPNAIPIAIAPESKPSLDFKPL